MTEAQPAQNGRKKIKPINLVGLFVMFLVIISLYWGGSTAINKDYLEGQLKILSDSLEQRAQQEKTHAKLSYDAINIEGWGFTKKAMIVNPTLQYGDLTVKTPRLAVSPDPVAAKTMLIDFIDPISYEMTAGKSGTVEFKQPPRYRLSSQRTQNNQTSLHSLLLRSTATVTTVLAGDTHRYQVDFGSRALFEQKTDMNGNADMVIEFGPLSINSERDGKRDVKYVLVKSSQKNGAEGQVQATHNISMLDYVVTPLGASAKPAVNLEARLNYEGGSTVTIANSQQLFSGDMKTQVETFRLSVKDFALSAKGEITASRDDVQPYGQLDVTVEKPASLAGSGLVEPATAELFVKGLSKAATVDASKEDTVTLVLKREKNGTFFVGATSFEQLAAYLLTAQLPQGLLPQAETAPAAPAADVPPEPVITAEPQAIAPVQPVPAPVPANAFPIEGAAPAQP